MTELDAFMTVIDFGIALTNVTNADVDGSEASYCNLMTLDSASIQLCELQGELVGSRGWYQGSFGGPKIAKWGLCDQADVIFCQASPQNFPSGLGSLATFVKPLAGLWKCTCVLAAKPGSLHFKLQRLLAACRCRHPICFKFAADQSFGWQNIEKLWTLLSFVVFRTQLPGVWETESHRLHTYI